MGFARLKPSQLKYIMAGLDPRGEGEVSYQAFVRFASSGGGNASSLASAVPHAASGAAKRFRKFIGEARASGVVRLYLSVPTYALSDLSI